MPSHRPFDTVLVWYFVLTWGAGYLAVKAALPYAPPFTLLALRFSAGALLMLPVLLIARPAMPATPRALFHVVLAGVLMHALNLGGSHYAQYLGMSAGISALTLSLQPLLTAMISVRWMHERLTRLQWLGVVLGFAGVILIVWHKINVRELSAGALFAVSFALVCITLGTLYQRRFCAGVDLRSGAVIQLGVSAVIMTPLAFAVEGAPVTPSWPLFWSLAYLVILNSILATNVLHTLMRHGEATRVTSLLYLTPIVAVALEAGMFHVIPNVITVCGIFVACAGVGLAAWRRREPPLQTES